MSPETSDLIRLIHDAPAKAVIAVTGGSRAIGDLLAVAGASRTLIEAIVPYSASALTDFLGAEPEQFCSERTARAMAMAALMRTIDLGDESPLLGLGCTASLAGDRPKRGSHRAHLALQDIRWTMTHSVQLEKGRRTRAEEEALLSTLLLNLLAEGCGLTERVQVDLSADEQVEVICTQADERWQDVLLGLHQAVCLPSTANAAAQSVDPTDRVIFPGAFDPLHEGHREMARIAAQLTGRSVDFELSILNVDKPPLDCREVARRAEQLAPVGNLWLTRTPTFREKADVFPAATFVVGVDTLERIAEDRYYDNDPRQRDAAIAHLAKQNCRFLVFGREVAGRFQSLDDLSLSEPLASICQMVPEAEFRRDVSSTELRGPGRQGDG
ncbi:MAG: hypothetical protein IID44_25600 [Planctomycetes bacterium]|nr:hypothetical protein [Planctomycetota bacterium]